MVLFAYGGIKFYLIPKNRGMMSNAKAYSTKTYSQIFGGITYIFKCFIAGVWGIFYDATFKVIRQIYPMVSQHYATKAAYSDN